MTFKKALSLETSHLKQGPRRDKFEGLGLKTIALALVILSAPTLPSTIYLITKFDQKALPATHLTSPHSFVALGINIQFNDCNLQSR